MSNFKYNVDDCTHTSDWWKHFVPCFCCGRPYDEDEADFISKQYAVRRFSDEEQKIIDQHIIADSAIDG